MILPFTVNNGRTSPIMGVRNPEHLTAIHRERQDFSDPGGSEPRTSRIKVILPFIVNGRTSPILGVRNPEHPTAVHRERQDFPRTPEPRTD